MATTSERPQPGDGPEYRANLLQWAEIVRPSVEKGPWYPDPPPMLPGETSEQYTDRLTGADYLNLRPFDHVRNRQCSIGYHEECSERDLPQETPFDGVSRTCQCPCHPRPLVLENLVNALEHVRLAASIHWFGQAFDPEHMRGIANLAIGALNGEPVPPLPDPTRIHAGAALWAQRLEDLAD